MNTIYTTDVFDTWFESLADKQTWRVYFTHLRLEVVILLAGGDKSSQTKDIATAQALARTLKE
jgi:putative component of toxin-antitoxin plasmid stabilization module